MDDAKKPAPILAPLPSGDGSLSDSALQDVLHCAGPLEGGPRCLPLLAAASEVGAAAEADDSADAAALPPPTPHTLSDLLDVATGLLARDAPRSVRALPLADTFLQLWRLLVGGAASAP